MTRSMQTEEIRLAAEHLKVLFVFVDNQGQVMIQMSE